MKTATFMTALLFSALPCDAAKVVTITCGTPVRSPKAGQGISVPVKVTNMSNESVWFFANGIPSMFQDFVTRGNSSNRWRNITPSMKGMCGMGMVAPQRVTLAPGESFNSTGTWVSDEHINHFFRVSLEVGKASAPDRNPMRIYSSAVHLR